MHTKPAIFVSVFFFSPYSSPFPIDMLATDAKTQKIEPFFMVDESFRGSV